MEGLDLIYRVDSYWHFSITRGCSWSGESWRGVRGGECLQWGSQASRALRPSPA